MHNPLKEISCNSSKRRLKKKACCIHFNTIFWGLFSGGGVNKLAYIIPSALAGIMVVVSVPALYYYCKRNNAEGPRHERFRDDNEDTRAVHWSGSDEVTSVSNDEGNTIVNDIDTTGNGNRDTPVL